MVRSISIYQPKNGIGEREFNQYDIISRQRKTRHLQNTKNHYKEEKKKLLFCLII